MTFNVKTVDEYVAQAPDDRRETLENLRKCILENLPEGFSEQMDYGMPAYVVPKTLYPAGYHCDTSHPLPFMAFASQKNYISFYHMGLYADEILMTWFVDSFIRLKGKKPDMGKSCLRFKKSADIPLDLLGELVRKIQPGDWIKWYEQRLMRRK